MMSRVSYKIAICEDDADYAAYLKKLIEESFEGILEIFLYNSGEDLLKHAKEMHDAVFMDIQLGGLDGTATAKKLRETNKNAVLAFCSGVVNPTPESIKVTPYRYLLKQFDEKTMKNEIMEILDKMVKSYKTEYILARHEYGFVRIYINDIAYITKEKRGSRIHLVEPGKYGEKEEFLTTSHLADLYKQLARFGFEFAHNSYLVNCRWVVRFDKTYLVLEGGAELNISRSRYMTFKRSFVRFWDKYGGDGNDD